jgi:hypothetical protein
MRLTLVDWFTGYPSNWDFFVSHASLESALVCTDQHDMKQFGDAAGKWQESMERERPKAAAAVSD